MDIVRNSQSSIEGVDLNKIGPWNRRNTNNGEQANQDILDVELAGGDGMPEVDQDNSKGVPGGNDRQMIWKIKNKLNETPGSSLSLLQ